MSKILVIKHGALGDIILATAAFSAIRQHHLDDHIVLLTTSAYADMLRASGYFDEVWIDTRPKFYQPVALFSLMEKVRSGGFTRVYDLQTSSRTCWYYGLMHKSVPEWSGIAKGMSYLHDALERTGLHTLERHKQQLAIAGIHDVPPPDVSWLKADIAHFALPERYVLIVAGGSGHRPGKRWPAHHYGTLCIWLVAHGLTPVLIGTAAEETVVSTVEAMCPQVRPLLGKTRFAEIAGLARHAICAIGNDTGPMHIIAASGCPSLSLFSQFSNPALCAPRGDNVTVIQEDNLEYLSLERVIDWVKKIAKMAA